MSLYNLGVGTELVGADVPQEQSSEKVSRTKVMIGIGATVALFAAIWALQRPGKKVAPVAWQDLEDRYRARGIDPRKVFG